MFFKRKMGRGVGREEGVFLKVTTVQKIESFHAFFFLALRLGGYEVPRARREEKNEDITAIPHPNHHYFALVYKHCTLYTE